MKTECLNCEATLTTVWLCPTCTTELRNWLRRLPGLDQELATTMARLDQMGGSVGGSSNMVAPSIVNFDAADTRRRLRRHLLNWTHTVNRWLTGNAPISFQIRHMCDYLDECLDAYRGQQGIGALHDETGFIVHQATTAIDKPRQHDGQDYAGPCGAVFNNGTCEHQLWVKHGTPTVTCPRCDTVWDVKARRESALAAAADLTATAGMISRALTAQGVTVTPENIRTWKARGRLVAVRENRAGQPLYRIGDVVALTKGKTT